MLEPTRLEIALIDALANPFENTDNYLESVRSYLVYYSAHRRENNGYFAPLVPIIQSSGVGKTRTMLELGGKHPVFYLQCRPLGHYYFVHGLILSSQESCKDLIWGCIVFLRDWALKWMGENKKQSIPIDFDWRPFSDLFKPAKGRINDQAKLWHYIHELGAKTEVQSNALEMLSMVPTVPKFFLVFDEAAGLLPQERTTDDLKADLPSPFRHIRRAVGGLQNGVLTACALDTQSKLSNFAPSYIYDPSLKLFGRENADLALPLIGFNTFDQGLFSLYNDMLKHMDDLIEWREGQKHEILCLGRVMWRQLYANMDGPKRFSYMLSLARQKLQLDVDERIDAVGALLLLAPVFLIGRHLADHYISRSMAIMTGCWQDRSEMQLTFYPEPMLYAAAWRYFEESPNPGRDDRVVEALDTLLDYIDSGLTNVGNAGEYVTMLLLLFACRAGRGIFIELDSLSFPLIKLEDFLANLFVKPVDQNTIPADCHLRFSSYYSLDAFGDALSPALLKVSFLRGLAIKMPQGTKGIDLLVPIYCKATEKIGCIAVQCKNEGSNNISEVEIKQIHGKMKEIAVEVLEQGAPLLSLIVNVSTETNVMKPFEQRQGLIVAQNFEPTVFQLPYGNEVIFHKL